MSDAEDRDLKLAALAGGSGALVWYVDDDRLAVDESAERLLGVRRGSFGGTVADLLQLARSDSRDAITGAFEQALGGAPVVTAELVFDLPGGVTRHLELRATMVRDPARVFGALCDITDLVKTRLELARAQEAVTSHERDRQRATASHQNLASGISRDIRTQLDAILGMSRLLADSALSPEQHERVATIHAGGTELLASVADLIDITTTDSELALATVDLATVLAEATSAIARDTRVRVHTRIAPEAPAAVQVDAARLRRIVRHALDAALALAPVDELALAARTTRLGGTLHELTIEVHTSGAGISHPRTTRLLEGTDAAGPIGIAIAGKLVARMGGRLALTSELAGGTTIALTVPVDAARATEATPEPIDLAQPLGATHPLRILVAEDNLTSRKITGAFLQRLGYEPRFASDGRSAVEAVTHDRFDVVFMDVQMPVMDGLEAARALRRLGSTAIPRIIALTANALPRDRAACLAAGCDDYLTKPVSIETLHRALRASPRIAAPLDPTCVDFAVLGDLEKMLAREIVDELLAAYDADGRELVAALQLALGRQDAKGLARAAHNLKSTSAAFGARSLGDTCSELEDETRVGRLERAAELVERATRQLTDVRLVLEDHRRR